MDHSKQLTSNGITLSSHEARLAKHNTAIETNAGFIAENTGKIRKLLHFRPF